MSIKQEIFSNDCSEYVALYGWQEHLGRSTIEFGYINSFKSAADDLVEKKLADLYIFPIIFCYRQYLELLLKNIYYSHNTPDKYKLYLSRVSHDLKKSFTEVKPFLLSMHNQNTVNKVEEIIDIFHNLDEGSYNFRYSTDKKLNKSLPNPLIINTKQLRKHIDFIDSKLRCTYDDC
ncbi:hypothetical protein [Metalysinibacillus jejuensis]|uniref:hypothetical protein n=1 Tax=Metalysinibacillus jejuensis TaxID=914327 RepID=UPI000D3B4AD7|nr:hypothetical protein [Metalysinibacillus jejuensis]